MQCEICGTKDKKLTNSEKFNMVLCSRHYKQFRKYGRELDNNTYGNKDKNKIEIMNSEAFISLCNKNGALKATTIIDIDDVDRVTCHKWNLASNGYVSSGAGKEQMLLHRFITNCPKGMTVDHIDHNILNNTKSNLRVVTNQQNNLNKGMYAHNTSGIKGVVWDKARNKWMSQIMVNNKTIHLGRFENIDDANMARFKAETKYFGVIMEGI